MPQNRIQSLLKNSPVKRAIQTLPARDQKKILLVVVVQFLTGVLDLIGVAMFGVVGALAVTGMRSGTETGKVATILKFLHLQDLSFQGQVAAVSVLATVVLLLRTVFSIYFMRKTLFFLSYRSAQISADLVSMLLGKSILEIQNRTRQETLHAVTYGVTVVTLGIVGIVVALISDGILMIMMLAGLFAVNSIVALTATIFFAAIAYTMYMLLNVRAKNLGMKNIKLSIESDEQILEALGTYRELVVRNRRAHYADKIRKNRFEIAETLAELQFLPNISKYIIELTIISGALIISAIQFGFQDSTHAIGTLAVFLAAGSRIAPAALRIQQGLVQLKSNIGVAEPTLNLIDELKSVPAEMREITDPALTFEYPEFKAEVLIKNLSFTYPGQKNPSLSDITLHIPEGSITAIVGPSGSGKSTLTDLCLGVLQPESGEVNISGISPLEAIDRWPGAIGYVPQDVFITNNTIHENVRLGYPDSDQAKIAVGRALGLAHLDIADHNSNNANKVGERGFRMSGGQRQRLGIARALFTNPRLLILDEATSALDGKTEADVSASIQELKGKSTIIIVAHRLSTVRNADQVVYISNGSVIAKGTFDEVRRLVPDFNHQANLMGLEKN